MSDKKFLIQRIEACEKYEFDKIVKLYLKEIYHYNRIVITDGKDDSGIDLKVFDSNGRHLQYQMTTQKSGTEKEINQLNLKINADLNKALKNHEEHGYDNTLIFFYSYKMTLKRKHEYEDIARNKGINLTIIEAAQIAEEATEYPALLSAIMMTTEKIGDYQWNSVVHSGTPQSLFYDLVGFGKVSDLKLELVEAYIFQCLSEREALTLKEISDLCMSKFKSSENDSFYSKLVNRLYHKEKVLLYSKETKKYKLTPTKAEEIKHRTELMMLEEKQFLDRVRGVLVRYGLEETMDDTIRCLKQIYVDNFSSRLSVSEDIVEGASLPNSLLKQIDNTETRKMAVKDILEICNEDKYLQRICASVVFGDKINLDQLQEHARATKKVYLDTTICLYLLCYFYNTKAAYDNFNYEQSRMLFEFCRKNRIKLNLTRQYLNEIVSHVEDAVRLEPFTRLANFSSLGSSRNVFFNHFIALQKDEEIHEDFYGYLEKLNFFGNIEEWTEKYLKELGIVVEEITPRYKIEDVCKIISIELNVTGKSKSPKALKNDAEMLEYLGDEQRLGEGTPIFVSWDQTLTKIRRQYFKIRPNAQRWYQLTPSQFVDRYALLSFSVSQETITKEMLAMLSKDIVTHVNSLIDTLTTILNPSDEVGLQYTNRFAEMRDSDIFIVDKFSDAPQEDMKEHVLDKIVYEIVTHYNSNKEIAADFKNLFLKKEHLDEVMKIFEDCAKYYKQNKKIDESTYRHIDRLITPSQGDKHIKIL